MKKSHCSTGDCSWSWVHYWDHFYAVSAQPQYSFSVLGNLRQGYHNAIFSPDSSGAVWSFPYLQIVKAKGPITVSLSHNFL